MFRWSGPGLRGGNRCEPSVLTVDKDISRFCRLFAVESGRVRCAAALRTPHPDTNNEPWLVTEQAVNRGKLSETNLYLSPLSLAALRPLPFPGLSVLVHWRRRNRSREVKRKKGVARILGPAGMDYFVGRAGDKIRRKMLETLKRCY